MAEYYRDRGLRLFHSFSRFINDVNHVVAQ